MDGMQLLKSFINLRPQLTFYLICLFHLLANKLGMQDLPRAYYNSLIKFPFPQIRISK